MYSLYISYNVERIVYKSILFLYTTDTDYLIRHSVDIRRYKENEKVE